MARGATETSRTKKESEDTLRRQPQKQLGKPNQRGNHSQKEKNIIHLGCGTEEITPKGGAFAKIRGKVQGVTVR